MSLGAMMNHRMDLVFHLTVAVQCSSVQCSAVQNDEFCTLGTSDPNVLMLRMCLAP